MKPTIHYTRASARSPRQWTIAAIIVTVFLAVTLVVAIGGSLRTRSYITDNFMRQTDIHRGQLALEELERLQSDEENAARGFALTRNPFYHDLYENSVRGYHEADQTIHDVLQREGMTSTMALIDDYDASHQSWRSDVAMPLIERGQSIALNIDKRNKTFADYEDKIASRIRSDLNTKSKQLAASTLDTINLGGFARITWLLIFGSLAIFLNVFQFRLNYSLETERSVTNVLQRGFRSFHTKLPHCEVGSSYVSASSNAAVGGDVFDIYRLADNHALLLIADVSGKGVDAAVLTAFIKFTLRGIAVGGGSPADIMAEFNHVFRQSVADPSVFATVFIGILETDTLRLEYVSAGHDAVFLRSNGIKQLGVTGAAVGILDEVYEAGHLQLQDADTLILATDGLTESRDRNGEFLGHDGAMALIEHLSDKPQQLADEIVAAIKARSGNHMRDDLAVLAVRVHSA